MLEICNSLGLKVFWGRQGGDYEDKEGITRIPYFPSEHL